MPVSASALRRSSAGRCDSPRSWAWSGRARLPRNGSLRRWRGRRRLRVDQARVAAMRCLIPSTLPGRPAPRRGGARWLDHLQGRLRKLGRLARSAYGGGAIAASARLRRRSPISRMLWADKQKPDRGAGLLRGRAGRSRIPSFTEGVVCRGRRPPLGATHGPAHWFRAAGMATPRAKGVPTPAALRAADRSREGQTWAGMRAVSQALGRAVTHLAAGCRRCSTLR
jgi:hypothetical protein